ncbi:MAG: OmpA family protein [Alphaproteobacteria bacterium]|jgi:outer membrane protein OmpA-like peptidoglycan-associated protein|nr:OmpA family protein [Alphaproteobacteria bacterium]|tara:strand:+ start:2075 stop:2701 length:627 start_codon:yes stop_codon:yes gene_type:complete
MKLIIKKFKEILFVSICIFIHNSILAIDPVEIGKPYQKDVEINLSIIENLNQDIKEEIKIDKDIRTKIKKKAKESVEIKTKNTDEKGIKTDDFVEKKFARIKEIIEKTPNEIQIIFNSETSNLKDEDANKIRNFINNKIDKKNSYFKITSYAKTDKTTDISRRLSLDRAINIRSILLKEGIPAKNLIVKSFGDAKNKENKVIIKFEKK